MTKKVADYLTNNMCLEGVIIEHDKSVYSYFIQIIIERTIGFLTIYIIALFQSCLFETVIFTLSFSELRKYTGGYHANSFKSCLIGTVGIYIIYIKFIYLFLFKYAQINVIAVVISSIVIFIVGVVNHPKMALNKKEYSQNKKHARIAVFCELLVILIFYLMRIAKKYVIFLSFGMILCAALIILAKITGQEVKYE